MHYTQLTEQERYQIYALNKAGHTQTEIATNISRNKSTISRELRRNCGQQQRLVTTRLDDVSVKFIRQARWTRALQTERSLSLMLSLTQGPKITRVYLQGPPLSRTARLVGRLQAILLQLNLSLSPMTNRAVMLVRSNLA